jgi:signal peptidase II
MKAPPLFRWVLLLALVVVVVDQGTKWWAVSALTGAEPVRVIGELIQLRLLYNPGAAFSIGTGFTWVLAVFAGVAVIAIAYVARRVRSRAWAVALGLLLGGAFTHLMDRLFRQPGFGRGHVVDFIDYAGYFVGNVADIALVTGMVLTLLLSLRGVRLAPE